MHVFDANSVDPNQMPQFAASDLGLYCLQMSHLWDSRYKWIKVPFTNVADDILKYLFYFSEKINLFDVNHLLLIFRENKS